MFVGGGPIAYQFGFIERFTHRTMRVFIITVNLYTSSGNVRWEPVPKPLADGLGEQVTALTGKEIKSTYSTIQISAYNKVCVAKA
jgi:hypothetical protein